MMWGLFNEFLMPLLPKLRIILMKFIIISVVMPQNFYIKHNDYIKSFKKKLIEF